MFCLVEQKHLELHNLSATTIELCGKLVCKRTLMFLAKLHFFSDEIYLDF